MSTKRFFFVLIAESIFSFSHMAANHKPQIAIIFEITTLVQTDVDGRKKALLKKMQETVRKSYSTMALWKSVRTAFDVPFMCNEREVRTEFFKFLSNISTPKPYPKIVSEGFTVPPIMSEWLLGNLNDTDAQQKADEFIHAQEYPENNKKFYHAMVYTTFDQHVSRQTRTINNKTEKLVNRCRTNGHKVYLIGHCNPETSTWLKSQYTELFAQFDKIFFSHQDSATDKTVFDDAWWLEHLGLDKHANYLFVSDWAPNGEKTDAPPHYTSTSKKLLAEIATSK